LKATGSILWNTGTLAILRHETGYPHIVKENGRKKYAGRAAGKPIPCRGKSSHAKGMPWPPVRIDNLPNSSLFRGRQSLAVFQAAITTIDWTLKKGLPTARNPTYSRG
jgi:hypothetical protein